MASPRYRFPAFYGGDAFGSPTAWWVVGWDEELLSFTGRLEMDREGETPGEDFDPDEGPMAVVGVTMGELAEPAELVDAMAEMEPDVQGRPDVVRVAQSRPGWRPVASSRVVDPRRVRLRVPRSRELRDPAPADDSTWWSTSRSSKWRLVTRFLPAPQERERAGSATPAQRRNWQKRKAELFERLAEARPEEPAYREAAENARRQLAELDHKLPTTAARPGS